MPLIRIIGKRPGYLLSLLSLCAINIWGFFSTTYGSLLASRIMGGFLTAAAEAPVSSVVADLFFFHERGHALMFFNLSISSGAFLGPLINAYITQYLGWKWICGVMAIISGATFVGAVFLIRETAYVAGTGGQDLSKPESAYPSKVTWPSSLGLTAGYDGNASFVGWMLSTAVLIAYPPVLVTGLICGLFIGCNIVVQLIASQTFTAPPWDWTIHSIGLLSISGFVGTVISFFIGGRLIDLIAIRMTARRSEHAEPEYRLPAMIIPAVMGPMGVLCYGLVIAAQVGWVGAAVGYAMQGFGATAGSNIQITYIVDAYKPVSVLLGVYRWTKLLNANQVWCRQIAGETGAIVFLLRNAIACLFSTYISVWIEQQGIRKAVGELVGVAYIILSLSLALFVWGKQIRAWTMKFGPMSTSAAQVS